MHILSAIDPTYSYDINANCTLFNDNYTVSNNVCTCSCVEEEIQERKREEERYDSTCVAIICLMQELLMSY